MMAADVAVALAAPAPAPVAPSGGGARTPADSAEFGERLATSGDQGPVDTARDADSSSPSPPSHKRDADDEPSPLPFMPAIPVPIDERIAVKKSGFSAPTLRGDRSPVPGAGLPAGGKTLPAATVATAVEQVFARAFAAAGEPAGVHAQAAIGDGRRPGSLADTGTGGPVLPAPAAAPAAGTLSAAAQPPPAAPPSQLPALNQPLGTPAWRADFANQVIWLTKHDVQSARLNLNPRHLGPIEVHIQLAQDQGQTQIWFHADNPATRAAVQSSLPQLQQLFDQHGLGLAGAHVSAQGSGGQGGSGHAAGRQSFSPVAGAGFDEPAAPAGVAVQTPAVLGLVDAYA